MEVQCLFYPKKFLILEVVKALIFLSITVRVWSLDEYLKTHSKTHKI